MHFIGITGGVGSGESLVLDYLRQEHGAYILQADKAAAALTKRGADCFEEYLKLFGEKALGADGELDRAYIASRVFKDESLREKMNALIHPAVKRYILEDVERIRLSGQYEFYFLEAALLIEENYDKICDELWYIYAKREVREERLKKSRGYSSERIRELIDSQTDEETFRRVCREVIDNSGSFEDTKKQTDLLIEMRREESYAEDAQG